MPKEILIDKLGVLIVLADCLTPKQNAVIMDRHAAHHARQLNNVRFLFPGVAVAPGTFFARAEQDKELKEAIDRISQRLDSKGVMPYDMRLDPDKVVKHEERQNVIRDMFGERDGDGWK